MSDIQSEDNCQKRARSGRSEPPYKTANDELEELEETGQ